MPIVRARDREEVVRYAGRRVRITTEWCDVNDDAIDKVRQELGDRLEEHSAEASDVASNQDQSEEVCQQSPASRNEKPQPKPEPRTKAKKAADPKSRGQKE